jgi:hypothetical protein
MTRRQLLWMAAAPAAAAEPAVKERVASALRRQLESVAGSEVNPPRIKGKDAAALLAMGFDAMHGLEGNASFARAAVSLSDGVLEGMRATPTGVMMIKEKRGGAMGGGPPALGWCATALGLVYRRSGGRGGDLRYLAGVIDRFPWNPEGWWSASVEIDGRSVMPLDKPTPVNKNAAMAMACAVLGDCVRTLEPALSTRLHTKASTCLERQIYPAQQPDGYWHYGLTGRDPNNKDSLGYFMLTAGLLVRLSLFAPSFRTPGLKRALGRAEEFAERRILPMLGGSGAERYDCQADLKRASQLAVLLWHGGYGPQTAKALDCWLRNYPYSDRGQEGGKSASDAAAMLLTG